LALFPSLVYQIVLVANCCCRSSEDSDKDDKDKTVAYKRTVLLTRSDELTRCVKELDIIYETILEEQKKDKSAVRLTRKAGNERQSHRKITSKCHIPEWILKTKSATYTPPPQFSAIASEH
jgi:hypothetical protein